MEAWQRFPLTLNIPITDAVRHDSCIRVESSNDLLERYPDMRNILEFDNTWKSLIAWPMLPYGVGLVLLQNSAPNSQEFEYLLRSIGVVVALNQLREHPISKLTFATNGKISKAKSAELTERQKLIRDLLLKGFTNLEISREIGYSESLVRHETIEIYRVLSVTGRKQLIAEAAALN